MNKEQVGCMICNNELGNSTCKMCGQLVGENCYDTAAGVCTKCKTGKDVEDVGHVY